MIRFVKVAYVTVILLLGLASIAMNAYPAETAFPVFLGIQSGLAVLTYPSGFVASLVGAGLIYSGILVPLEAFLMITPIFAGLGYLQWFWLFPRLYGRSITMPEA